MRLLLIDNRDSFTFSLAEACRVAGAEVEVVRNTIAAEAALDRALRCGASLMLSPGPGGLGHQAIVEFAGGAVVRAHEPCHGKSSAIAHDGQGPFAGLPSPMRVGRYHSLCTPLGQVPERLRVHASLDGMAMAISDEEAGQVGLQFHPESILTPLGARLLAAVLGWVEARRADFGLTGATRQGKVAA